jgi:hypothetical protein
MGSVYESNVQMRATISTSRCCSVPLDVPSAATICAESSMISARSGSASREAMSNSSLGRCANRASPGAPGLTKRSSYRPR